MACEPRNSRGDFLNFFVVICFFTISVFSGCSGLKEARMIKKEPMPPRYYPVGPSEKATAGSLWRGGNQGLFRDNRASGINDLVTIKIVESAKGAKTATTDTERTTSDDRSVTSLFGLPLNLTMRDFLGAGTSFLPELKGGVKTLLGSDGETTRGGTLSASITAKVAEVLPNGNFVLEARKETLINNENQILVLRGIVRPLDIRSNNTVLSTYIADAKISFTGEGVLDDQQAPGWMTRVLDHVWPF